MAAVAAGKLEAHTSPQRGDIYIICVPTPFHENGPIPTPNVDHVMSAARSIAGFLKHGDLVVLESTSPVGTLESVHTVLESEGVDTSSIHLAYCPERVLPGRIMSELVENDRIIGGWTSDSARAVAEFYRSFVRGEVIETDSKTAEMCKLVENSYRDVNIAFANELSLLCAAEGIDVWSLIKLANRHPRVNILSPGVGVGGHCIAVDPWFIAARDPDNSRLIQTARNVNNRKPHWAVEKILTTARDLGSVLGRAPRVACLGLAFKPDIDDLRESPAIQVTESLIRSGVDVVAVEPNIEVHPSFPLISLESALSTSDLCVLLVRHRQFVSPVVRARLEQLPCLDFCGALA